MIRRLFLILSVLCLLLGVSCSAEAPCSTLVNVQFDAFSSEAKAVTNIDADYNLVTNLSQYKYRYIKATPHLSDAFGGTEGKYVLLEDGIRTLSQGGWDFSVICLNQNQMKRLLDKTDTTKSNNVVTSFSETSMSKALPLTYMKGEVKDVWVNLSNNSISIRVLDENLTSMKETRGSLSITYETKLKATDDDLHYYLSFLRLEDGVTEIYDTAKDASTFFQEKRSEDQLEMQLTGSKRFSEGKYILTLEVRDSAELVLFTDTIAFSVYNNKTTSITGDCTHVDVTHYGDLELSYSTPIEIPFKNLDINFGGNVVVRHKESEPVMDLGNGRKVPFYECMVSESSVDVSKDYNILATLTLPDEFASDCLVVTSIYSLYGNAPEIQKTVNEREVTLSIPVTSSAKSSFQYYELQIHVLDDDDRTGELVVGLIVGYDKVTTLDGSYLEFTGNEGEVRVIQNPTTKNSISGSVAIPTTLKVNGEDVAVTKLAENFFSGVNNCSSITIPSSIVEIGTKAFYGNTGLLSVEIMVGKDGLNVGASAFESCKKLQYANFQETAVSGEVVFSGRTFNDNHYLRVLHLPSTLKKMYRYDIASCMALESLELPRDLETLDAASIGRCLSLKELTVAEGNTNFISMGNCILQKNSTTQDTYDLVVATAYSTIPACVTVFRTSSFPWFINTNDVDLFTYEFDLKYEGTVKDWEAITKRSDWNRGCVTGVSVQCKDGVVSLDAAR